MHRNTARTTTDATRTIWDMGLKMNIAKTKVMFVDNTPINVNNVLLENVQGYVYLGQYYSLKEKNQDKEIQRRIMAGWAAYMPNTGTSSKTTLPSDWRERCTTPVCCQLWHMVQRTGHWANKHRTNLPPHRPKWKEVCSTSYTKIERPTSGSGRGQKS